MMSATMLIGNLDKAINLDKDTKGAVRDLTLECVDSNIGVWDKHWSNDVYDHGEAYDDIYDEPHDKEGWIEDHD